MDLEINIKNGVEVISSYSTEKKKEWGEIQWKRPK